MCHEIQGKIVQDAEENSRVSRLRGGNSYCAEFLVFFLFLSKSKGEGKKNTKREGNL